MTVLQLQAGQAVARLVVIADGHALLLRGMSGHHVSPQGKQVPTGWMARAARRP
jgi:hypothetical protein